MTWLFMGIDLSVAALFLVLSLLALSNGGYRLARNRTFAGVSVCLLAWLATNQISNSVSLCPKIATIADYILFCASFVVVLLTLRLMTQITLDKQALHLLTYVEPPMWVMAAICATPLVGAGVVRQGAVYAVVFGPAAWLYGALVSIMTVAILWLALRNWNHRLLSVRKQIRSVGIGLFITAPLVLAFGFVIPYVANDFSITQISLAPTIVFAVALYISVVQHGLFDIKLAAIRTTAYIMSIATMAGAYFGLAYLASMTIFRGHVTAGLSMSPINVILALILAFIFQPIKQFFDHWTDRIFYRGRYDTNEFITRLGQVLTSTTRLHDVLERAGREIQDTLKSHGYVFIVYRDHHPDAIVGDGLRGHFDDKEYAALREATAHVSDSVIATSSLERSHGQARHQLHTLLARHTIALMLPLKSADDLIGYLLLGEQQGSGYGRRDMSVLEAIADELVIAVQNARSVQVVRDTNAHLEQRVNEATRELRRSNRRLLELDATKDDFLSMASHQLRTPLTSIKGYISMVLEGDAGAITDTQRQLLGEAFTSSERMVHLIADFLNVSRLQTGKFVIDRQQVDLAAVTAQEVDSMRQIAESHGMTIAYTPPKVFPLLYLDDGKIRQVIMNFIDNAIYYSPEGKRITVTLSIEDGSAVLRVIDNGMGVPPDVQRKLFTKFFRAENARRQRPDGTGVGLFLAKKVVDGHGGGLVFTSILGKGSTFGFRLPVKRLSMPPSSM